MTALVNTQTEVMSNVSIFGAGFIGGWFASTYPEEFIVPRDHAVTSEDGDILYMRSTVHNYHPKEGIFLRGH